jgi:hypothetical protein
MDIFLVHTMTREWGILEKGKGHGKKIHQEHQRDDIYREKRVWKR